MKKVLIFALAAMTVLVSCQKQEDTKLSKVVLNPTELILDEGSSQTIEMTVQPSAAVYTTVVWSSSNTNVATVTRKGSVTAVAAGTAVISCKVDDIEATCKVTVNAVVVPVTSVSLDKESISLGIDETQTLTATVVPENASNKKVSWSCSDPTVASVDEGTVKGLAKGKCTVTATTEDGSFKAECAVTVTAPATINILELEDGAWSKNTYPVFSPDCKTAYVITLQTRKLVAIDLERAMVKWQFDLNNTAKAWAANGGNICVNPSTGDIICSNQCEVFAVTSSGSQKWSFQAEGTTADITHSALLGSGPAMSGDNSVIFAPLEKGLYAVNATDGSILSMLELSTGSCEFAVYGSDRIVFHENSTTGTNAISFIKFESNTLSIEKQIDSPITANSDITCPVISKDQTKAYFFGKKAMACVDLTSQEVSSSETSSSNGAAQRWAGALNENGMLAYGTVFNGSNAAICVINAAQDLSAENCTAAYKYAGYNSAFNFEGVVADRDGNFYSFVNDCEKAIDTETAYSYFLKTSYNGEAYVTETVAKTPAAAKGTFQGAFAFGGNYLVACQGKTPGQVLICEIDAERAHSWANGGDACGTKNANNIK